jgi:hypothetical protein
VRRPLRVLERQGVKNGRVSNNGRDSASGNPCCCSALWAYALYIVAFITYTLLLKGSILHFIPPHGCDHNACTLVWAEKKSSEGPLYYSTYINRVVSPQPPSCKPIIYSCFHFSALISRSRFRLWAEEADC